MLKKLILLVMAVFCATMTLSCGKKEKAVEYAQLSEPKDGDPIAVIKTSMGDITVVLFPQYAPKAVENFTTHAKDGYYDGVIFHRVIDDFMIQGGDPTGTGSGGESIYGEPFEDEIVMELHNIRGALSMANSGVKTNGSQFFIVQNTDIGSTFRAEFEKAVKDVNYASSIKSYSSYNLAERFPVPFMEYYLNNGGAAHLDSPGFNYGYKHTVFGQVIDGMDIVDQIAAVSVDANYKPLEDVIINTIEIGEYKK